MRGGGDAPGSTITILYYTILYYTILYRTVLYYTILYYTILLSSFIYVKYPPTRRLLPDRGGLSVSYPLAHNSDHDCMFILKSLEHVKPNPGCICVHTCIYVYIYI